MGIGCSKDQRIFLIFDFSTIFAPDIILLQVFCQFSLNFIKQGLVHGKIGLNRVYIH